MARRKLPPSKYIRGGPTELGIFSRRHEDAAAKALSMLASDEFFKSEFDYVSDFVISDKLANYAYAFYSDRNAESCVSEWDIRAEATSIRVKFANVLAEISSLPPTHVDLICREANFARRLARFVDDEIVPPELWEGLKSLLAQAILGCDRVLKVPRPPLLPTALERLCIKLMPLRETLTKKPFTRTWRMKDGQNFIAADPRFIQVIVNAFEPSILPAEVSTALRAAARKIGPRAPPAAQRRSQS